MPAVVVVLDSCLFCSALGLFSLHRIYFLSRETVFVIFLLQITRRPPHHVFLREWHREISIIECSHSGKENLHCHTHFKFNGFGSQCRYEGVLKTAHLAVRHRHISLSIFVCVCVCGLGILTMVYRNKVLKAEKEKLWCDDGELYDSIVAGAVGAEWQWQRWKQKSNT